MLHPSFLEATAFGGEPLIIVGEKKEVEQEKKEVPQPQRKKEKKVPRWRGKKSKSKSLPDTPPPTMANGLPLSSV